LQNSTKSLVATSLAHFVNDGTGYIFIYLNPTLFTSVLYIGILASLQNVFSIAASPFIGRRADATKNYGQLLVLGIVLLGIGTAGFAEMVLFASGFYLFLLVIPFTIIGGIGSSFYHPLGGTILSETWGTKASGRPMGINGSMGSLGRALYPLFVAAIVVPFGVPSVGVLAVVTIVIAEAIHSVFKSMRLSQVKEEEVAKREEKRVAVAWNKLLPGILALTVLSFFRGIFSLGTVTIIPEYLKVVNHVATGYPLAIEFSIMLGMGVIGQPFFGYTADRFGRRLTLGVAIAGSFISMLLFLNTQNQILSVVYLALYGFFIFTGFPLLLPLAMAISPEGSSTKSGSIVWGVGNVGGGAVGPTLIAVLSNPGILGSLQSAFYVVTFLSIISLVLLPLVPRPRSK
jgi:MFS transporter, FSR family, fosmidomycin resistance protein